MNRREFLTAVGLALTPALGGLSAAPKRQRRLILIELDGGNDGLNTLVPYKDPLYRELRPTLSLPGDTLIQLDEQRALHPSLSPVHALWRDKELAVVEGLGYDEPNRSHFRSRDIWSSGSDASELKKTGWLADALQQLATEQDISAVVFGGRTHPFAGKTAKHVNIDSLKSFLAAPLAAPGAAPSSNNAAQWINAVQATTARYQKQLIDADIALQDERYGDNKFAAQLRDASLLIRSDLAPSVLKLHLKGFDTHANQLERHDNLMKKLAEGLKTFADDLREQGQWGNTLIATYSEFGRRAKENASGGTDHGTAAPHFVLGGSVKGGFYGATASLKNLQNNDLVHTLDYRSLYTTLLKDWLKLADSRVNLREFPSIGFI